MAYQVPEFSEIQPNKIISLQKDGGVYSALITMLDSAADAYLSAEGVDFKLPDAVNPHAATTGFKEWQTYTSLPQLKDHLNDIMQDDADRLLGQIITADDAFDLMTKYMYELCAIRTCKYKYYKSVDAEKYTSWSSSGLYFKYETGKTHIEHNVNTKYVADLAAYRNNVRAYAEQCDLVWGQIVSASSCNLFVKKLLAFNASKQQIYNFGARNKKMLAPAQRVEQYDEFTASGSEDAMAQAATRMAYHRIEHGDSARMISLNNPGGETWIMVWEYLQSAGSYYLDALFPDVEVTNKYS